MSNSKLVNVNVPAYSGNYTRGRNQNISKITIHHMAGILSAEQCGAIFQRVGRNGSSNYGIGNDGKIGLYVDECNTPWTDGNWDSNCKSVTIETSNCEINGSWKVSDAALNSLIKLVADIAKRNKLGNLVVGKNLTWHRMYQATTCPGDYLLSKMEYIANEANKINNKSEYFVAGNSYKLTKAKYLRRNPSLDDNVVPYNLLDPGSKRICNNKDGKAQLKKGTIVEPLQIIKDGKRRWASYGNCWWVCQDKDGTKNAKRV